VGLGHTISKGFSVGGPSDIRGKRPYVWRDDPVGPVLFQVLGGVTAVPLGVPEVLPSLNTGAINIVTAPALAAEQLQWASRLDNINTEIAGARIGAFVVSTKKLDSLPADAKAILLQTGEMASAALTGRIRREDAAAYDRLKAKMTASDPTEAQKNEWSEVFKQVRTRVAQGTFPRELVERVEGLAK
jgi:TRAP-type C4-dicarboxylate transport system substrate-binding protein